MPGSYFCDSCEFLWQALFVPLLFLSQPFSGHKETQNSQEEQWHQPRIDHCHHCYSTALYQTTYENYKRNFSRPAQIFHISSTEDSQCVYLCNPRNPWLKFLSRSSPGCGRSPRWVFGVSHRWLTLFRSLRTPKKTPCPRCVERGRGALCSSANQSHRLECAAQCIYR